MINQSLQLTSIINSKNKNKILAGNALYTALYVALCYIFQPISFSAIQFRIAESMMVFSIFDDYAIVSLTVGCFISNLLLSGNIFDILFGSLATFIGLFISKFLKSKNYFLKMLPIILSNGIIIPFVLKYGYGFSDIVLWTEFLFVSIGEVVVLYTIGFIIYLNINRVLNKKNIV